ncbi:hypothetical protein [Cellulomonas wangsupingiae]|uniref:HIRAN domain-containing protein n=1 Tax=Cellulomonas wangsupingiae TaxID=2968085 RepID=A0ABY5K5J6_9CELL|nr:hypothetical protein [Cellulomonas wangsupingiae]MCC2334095.1 hypothetical protein [Cellulomonas wangsupingiae]UUI65338.1 hypothetical protein NP075_00940 [Cellulomonas wangsupingiae]
MGFWSKLFGKTATTTPPTTGRAQQVVVVAFRELTAPDPLRHFSPESGYAYLWPFAQEPQVGQWAIAPGLDGPASVVVGAIGLPAGARGMTLKALSGLIPPAQVQRARDEAAQVAQRARDEVNAAARVPARGWNDDLREVERGQSWGPIEVDDEHLHRAQIARIFHHIGYLEGGETFQKARLLPEGRGRVRVEVFGEPVGYVGAANASMVSNSVARIGRGNVAVIGARIWATAEDGTWRSRVTLEHGASGRERDNRAERIAAEAEQAAKAEARRAREQEKAAKHQLEATARAAGSFDGEHWTIRKPVVTQLKKNGSIAEAAALLERCVTAAEAEARVRGGAPEQWPTTQLGMILRANKDTAAELALLEQYATACGTAPIPDRIAANLDRARATA